MTTLFTARPARAAPRNPTPTRRGTIGRTVALVACLAQVVAAFLPWAADGRLGLDVGLLTLGATDAQPTVAIALIGLAAVAAVPALLGDWGVPRTASAAATGLVTVTWLAAGPDGVLTSGVVTALAAAVLHLVGAALATGGAAAPSPSGTGPQSSGYRSVDHTADVAFETWGPTREASFLEAVRALVDSFADIGDAAPEGRHEVRLEEADPEDLLVDLLGEVIYLLDVHGAVPVGGVLQADDGGMTGHFDLAPVSSVRHAGAVPKAVTYHGLTVNETPEGWWCKVTVDV